MGKDLKGKELGVGISQIASGKYVARFTNNSGKRVKKEFDKLQQCRNWIADAKYNEEHGNLISKNMTVDTWFDYWITEIKGKNVRPNTLTNYNDRYRVSIKPTIGNMLLQNVKPFHCQLVLNKMSEKYKTSTIKQVRLTMYNLFESALENELIEQNPVKKSVQCKVGNNPETGKSMTLDEQKHFLNACPNSVNYNQYAFVLQTGLRVGELIGLKWEDVDFKKSVIHVRRTMQYVPKTKSWRIGEPKSKNGARDIPLTAEAIRILNLQKERNKNCIVYFEYKDFVFLTTEGKPSYSCHLDSAMYKICRRAKIPKYSMHSLRHTFATRCIEGGMTPKTLQMILGHSNIRMTMDLYVHVTEDTKSKEIAKIESILKVV